MGNAPRNDDGAANRLNLEQMGPAAKVRMVFKPLSNPRHLGVCFYMHVGTLSIQDLLPDALGVSSRDSRPSQRKACSISLRRRTFQTFFTILSPWHVFKRHGSHSRNGLMRRDVLALLGHRALHQQHQNDECHRQDGAQPEDVEVGQRRGLLLAEVVERLDSPTVATGPGRRSTCRKNSWPWSRNDWTWGFSGPRHSPRRDRWNCCAPLLDGLGHRGADAAPFGAEQAEQSDRRPAQMQRECTCRRPR